MFKNQSLTIAAIVVISMLTVAGCQTTRKSHLSYETPTVAGSCPSCG